MDNPALIAPQSTLAVSPSPAAGLNAEAAPTVGLALLGLGRWGRHLLRNFLALPEARVLALVDPHERPLRQAQQVQLPADTLLTTDWQQALQIPGLEAIAIATPAATHYPLIRAALEQGLHVLAEKPLTLDPREALELCQLAAYHQRQLVIDHTYLFHPAVQQGRLLLQQGQVGPLRYGYATRSHLGPVRQDVDALWDLAIHDIAMFNHWLNETPCQVQAQGRTWLQTEPMPSFPQGLADLVWVTLIYPSGFHATLHLSWANPDKQRRLCVVGDRGTLIFDELAASPLMLHAGELHRSGPDSNAAGQFIPTVQPPQAIRLETTEPLHAVCRHFLACVQQNTASTISPGTLGAELVQILAALSLSLKLGGRVVNVAS